MTHPVMGGAFSVIACCDLCLHIDSCTPPTKPDPNNFLPPFQAAVAAALAAFLTHKDTFYVRDPYPALFRGRRSITPWPIGQTASLD